MPKLSPPLNREKLVKVLNLTDNTFDGEAINAMRLALKMMKESEVTWDSLLLNGSSGGSAFEMFSSVFSNGRAEELLRRKAEEIARQREAAEAAERSARQARRDLEEARRGETAKQIDIRVLNGMFDYLLKQIPDRGEEDVDNKSWVRKLRNQWRLKDKISEMQRESLVFLFIRYGGDL